MNVDLSTLPHWLVIVLSAWATLNVVSRSIPDEMWAKLPPSVLAVIRFSRSAGPDNFKAVQQIVTIVQEVLKAFNSFKSGGPPLAGALLIAAAIGACVPAADVPRYAARGSVLTVVYAVQIADEACMDIATEKAKLDRPAAEALAEKCDHGYQVARHGLIAAAKAVDAWTEASKGELACAIADGVAGLRETVATVEAEGVKLPSKIVEDAFAAADEIVKLGGECKVKP
jgi:hypothetical protein